MLHLIQFGFKNDDTQENYNESKFADNCYCAEHIVLSISCRTGAAEGGSKLKACSRQLERRLEILTSTKWRTIHNEVTQQGWVYIAVPGDWRCWQEMSARRFLLYVWRSDETFFHPCLPVYDIAALRRDIAGKPIHL
jgi:hypothetical protein